MLVLETDRLQFKRYTKEDLQYMQSLTSNIAVVKYIGDGKPKTLEWTKILLERTLEQYRNFDDFGLHMLIHKESGAFIGHAGLVAQIVDEAFEVEIGYWIDETYWRQGYGFEAAKALKQYAEEELELTRFISLIQPENKGSVAIAEKNGMVVEKEIEMDDKRVLVYETTCERAKS